jgi:hypothetical protein
MGKLNLQALHVRHRHSAAVFATNILLEINVAPRALLETAGTQRVTSLRSALQ